MEPPAPHLRARSPRMAARLLRGRRRVGSLSAMVRTTHDALELLGTTGVLTEVPAHGVRSLVEAVAGGPVEGSWRQHHRGKLMYRLGRKLRAEPGVLALRLVEGKLTFVDSSIWPVVYRVVMDSVRRRSALVGLSEDARALLARIERFGMVRTDVDPAPEKAREALEERLLVRAFDREVEPNQHVVHLQSWRAWASEGVRETAAAYGYEEALESLRQACGGAPGGFGPWVLPAH